MSDYLCRIAINFKKCKNLNFNCTLYLQLFERYRYNWNIDDIQRQLWFHTRSTGGAIKDWRVKSHWHGSLRCDISSCLLYLSILWCKCCWDKQLNLLRTSFRWSFTCIFEHAVYWDTTLYFTYSLVRRYTYSIANQPIFRLQIMNCKTRL